MIESYTFKACPSVFQNTCIYMYLSYAFKILVNFVGVSTSDSCESEVGTPTQLTSILSYTLPYLLLISLPSISPCHFTHLLTASPLHLFPYSHPHFTTSHPPHNHFTISSPHCLSTSLFPPPLHLLTRPQHLTPTPPSSPLTAHHLLPSPLHLFLHLSTYSRPHFTTSTHLTPTSLSLHHLLLFTTSLTSFILNTHPLLVSHLHLLKLPCLPRGRRCVIQVIEASVCPTG